MTMLHATFTACEESNPAALAESRRRAGIAHAQAVRDAEQDDDKAEWLFCDYRQFMRHLEAREREIKSELWRALCAT